MKAMDVLALHWLLASSWGLFAANKIENRQTGDQGISNDAAEKTSLEPDTLADLSPGYK
jgi:hypothetical protein